MQVVDDAEVLREEHAAAAAPAEGDQWPFRRVVARTQALTSSEGLSKRR